MLIFIFENFLQPLILPLYDFLFMEDIDIMKSKYEEFRNLNGTWVECGKCRALMYDSFGNCWSCGSDMTDGNATQVNL